MEKSLLYCGGRDKTPQNRLIADLTFEQIRSGIKDTFDYIGVGSKAQTGVNLKNSRGEIIHARVTDVRTYDTVADYLHREDRLNEEAFQPSDVPRGKKIIVWQLDIQ